MAKCWIRNLCWEKLELVNKLGPFLGESPRYLEIVIGAICLLLALFAMSVGLFSVLKSQDGEFNSISVVIFSSVGIFFARMSFYLITGKKSNGQLLSSPFLIVMSFVFLLGGGLVVYQSKDLANLPSFILLTMVPLYLVYKRSRKGENAT